jgi:hypothetical protein
VVSSSKDLCGSVDAIAGQACVIEDILNSRKAVVSDKRIPLSVPNASEDIQRSQNHRRRGKIIALKHPSSETKPAKGTKEERPDRTQGTSMAPQDVVLQSESQSTQISSWRQYNERAKNRQSQAAPTQQKCWNAALI